MKKILSLTLAVLMVVSMIPTAFAADVDYKNGTEVEYTGTRSSVEDDGSVTHNAEYTITVPALLAPGGSGTVTLEGYWPSDATVKVTAEEKVEVVNDINSADKKELAVTFASIEKAGSNTAIVTASAPVSVANIENALFGKWAGKFNYNVDYVAGSGNTGGSTGGDSGTTEPSDPDTGDDDVVTSEGSATFSDGVTLSWAELQLAENETKYGYVARITNTSVYMNNCDVLTSIVIPEGITTIADSGFGACNNLVSINIPSSVINIGMSAFAFSTKLTTISFAGTTAQWNAITFGENWKSNVPATEVICSDGTVSLS